VLMEAARAYVTLGEMVGALKESWGIYVESPWF
jgi:methylmalonyl-CoA mutase N-terminal domain/subunit